MRHSFAVIGPGRVGQAIAALLHQAGEEVVALIGRDQERVEQAEQFVGRPGIGTTDLHRSDAADTVLLALPDDYLAAMATRLRDAGLARNSLLIHFSGFHPAGILLDQSSTGQLALSIHPLQSFADAATGVRNLPGTPCAVEGDEAARPRGEELVRLIGGAPFPIASEQKTLYHAAACIASNYLVANTKAACEALEACGFEADEAFRLLQPILSGTARNLAALGPDQALTGPISRGDVQTVQAHLVALGGLPEDLAQIYRSLGKKAVQIGRERGSLKSEAAGRILDLLKSPGRD